jgi:uncharacterized protein
MTEREGDEQQQPRPDEPPPPSRPHADAPVSPRDAVSTAFGVTIATGAVMTFAFDPARAGQPAMVGSIGALYALLTVVTLARLHRRGELRERFRRASGDVTFGALTAGALYGAGRIALMAIAPRGTPAVAWIARLYLQIGRIGDDASAGRAVGLAVLAVAALEEIVWRGLVMLVLLEAFGARRAVVITAALFALAHVSTAFLLRDPVAGLNPLVILAGLGCSLVWGAMVVRTGRLLPALVAHALFSWSVIEFPLWRM